MIASPTATNTTGGGRIVITIRYYVTGTGDTLTGSGWEHGNYPSRTAHGEYRVESAAYRETYRRLSRVAQRAAARVERFRKAIEEAALRAVPHELRVDVRRRVVAMPDPSQLELAPTS